KESLAGLGRRADAATIYRTFVGTLVPKTGACVLGEKYAGRGDEIARFRQLFPDGKILATVRDPRDVLLSNGKRIEQESNMEHYWDGAHLMVLDDWANLSVLHRIHNQTQTSSYLQIRYEDLVGAPEETMHKVCAFLAVPFRKEVLVEGALRHDDGREWR